MKTLFQLDQWYFLALIILISFPSYLTAQNLKKAKVENVSDDYFGMTITDAYRWMEDLTSLETKQWMQSQSDYAHYYLSNLPLRKTFLDRLNVLDNAGTIIYGLRKRGDKYFYYKQEPGENNAKVYLREGISGAERLLVDPDKFVKNGKQAAVTSFSPSPDGYFLSFLIAEGGGEYGMIRVMQTQSGKITGDIVENTRWNAGNWTPDSRSFAYYKFQKLSPGSPETERDQKITSWLHILNTKPSNDKPLFGFGINPDLKLNPAMMPSVYFPISSKYAVAQFNDGVSQHSDFYIAPISTIRNAQIAWKKIISLKDNVRDIAEFGDYFYVQTYKDASRYKIIRINSAKPDLKTAQTVFPVSEAVIQNMAPAQDALYVSVLDGGIERIYTVDYQTLKSTEIKSPYPGSLYLRDCQPDRQGAQIGIQSWTKSNAVFEYDPNSKTLVDTKILKPIPIDMSAIEVTDVKVKSHDGVMVPIVILHKKDVKLDGNNPLLMRGYGAYSVTGTSPFFNTKDLPWLERGGIIVFAGIRGGGEYGEEWHMGGFQETKPNTWKDFIACAEFLIENKYTNAKHLGIQGGSAGGILISNAIAERPELFAAAIINVGVNNPVRFETTANGVLNVGEFGTVETESGFKALRAMDGYLKIRDGLNYPAVLLTHGINDPRVVPWMSAKMAARLQAATSNKKPVILRIEYDGGHGLGGSRNQQNAELAETFAFLAEQLGMK